MLRSVSKGVARICSGVGVLVSYNFKKRLWITSATLVESCWLMMEPHRWMWIFFRFFSLEDFCPKISFLNFLSFERWLVYSIVKRYLISVPTAPLCDPVQKLWAALWLKLFSSFALSCKYRILRMQRKIITTGDGPHSIEVLGKNELHHSKSGAAQQPQHVYIEAGLNPLLHYRPAR
jgi:hypothetical protein